MSGDFTPVTLESVREKLKEGYERFGHYFDAEVMEQAASAVRDALIEMGLDPADETTIKAFLVGSFLALGHLSQSVVVIGPAIPCTLMQADVARKWLDHEMPILTLAEIESLRALEGCDFVYPWPDGFGSSRCLLLKHDTGSHEVSIIEYGDDGGLMAKRIEVEG